MNQLKSFLLLIVCAGFLNSCYSFTDYILRRGFDLFKVLRSNGEQFRAGLARLICDAPDKVVVDEFTSVVDKQIAKIGSDTFAKS